MPFIKTINNGEKTKIGIWKCTETEAELLNLIQLNSIDALKLSQFTNSKRKVHFLATRNLLKQMTGSELVVYADSGKPFTNNINEYIGISHSGDYVAVHVSPSQFIGLDIQKIDEKIHKIKSRFVNEIERAQIDYDDTKILTLIWSIKEAIYKIHGDRNVFFKEHIVIKDLSDLSNGTLTVSLTHHHYIGTHQIKFEYLENYILVYTCLEQTPSK